MHIWFTDISYKWCQTPCCRAWNMWELMVGGGVRLLLKILQVQPHSTFQPWCSHVSGAWATSWSNGTIRKMSECLFLWDAAELALESWKRLSLQTQAEKGFFYLWDLSQTMTIVDKLFYIHRFIYYEYWNIWKLPEWPSSASRKCLGLEGVVLTVTTPQIATPWQNRKIYSAPATWKTGFAYYVQSYLSSVEQQRVIKLFSCTFWRLWFSFDLR